MNPPLLDRAKSPSAIPPKGQLDLYGNVKQIAPMDMERRYFSIGEMCETFGVTARALRFYEDERLIAPERRGTARLYTDRDRARLTWILRGKRVGFSLNELREMIDLYDLGDSRETQRLVTIDKCKDRIAALRRQRVDIDATVQELEKFVAQLGGSTEVEKG